MICETLTVGFGTSFLLNRDWGLDVRSLIPRLWQVNSRTNLVVFPMVCVGPRQILGRNVPKPWD
jgi:hypothetical protein